MVSAKIMRERFDDELRAGWFKTGDAAKLVDERASLALGAFAVIFRTDLGAIFAPRSRADVEVINHKSEGRGGWVLCRLGQKTY